MTLVRKLGKPVVMSSTEEDKEKDATAKTDHDQFWSLHK